MTIQNYLSKIITSASFCGMLFCFLFVSEVSAQSDKEKIEMEQVKPSSDFYNENERQENTDYSQEKKLRKTNSSSDSVVRDNSGYRVEDQKEVKDEGKSTLSFNIFLYVLDRFKEY
jgi:hypothetical protein